MVGRLDTKETVLERLAALKAYGQCSVVIDLIYGLPGQTMEVWEQDLADLVSSGVDGADLYQLNVFDGSDLNKDIAKVRCQLLRQQQCKGICSNSVVSTLMSVPIVD